MTGIARHLIHVRNSGGGWPAAARLGSGRWTLNELAVRIPASLACAIRLPVYFGRRLQIIYGNRYVHLGSFKTQMCVNGYGLLGGAA
jgi:hypothetical protein